MSQVFPRVFLVLLACAAALVTAAPAYAVSLSSSFDSNSEGWQVGYDPISGSSPAFLPAAWTATGGNPTGHLIYSPIDQGGGFYQAGYFRSPAAWFGDALQNYGGSFQFDARTTGTPEAPPIVYLFRGTLPLGDEAGEAAIVSALDEPIQSSAWSHYSIPLNPASWRDLSGQPADEFTFRHTLQGLDGALVSVEGHLSVGAAGHDSSEQGKLDNPALGGGSAPPPVEYSREVTISYKGGAFKGVVSSLEPNCAFDEVVTVHRKKKGPDRVVGDDQIDDVGAYAVPASRRPGTYYAKVPADSFAPDLGLSCDAAKSKVKRLR